MTSIDYEQLVLKLISELTQRLQSSSCRPEIAGGRSNKIAGASGFPHQIDVSLKTDRALRLVECKYWRDPVDVEPVLVIASRLADIRAAKPGLQVEAAVVSTQAPTAGAKTLARYFGVRLDVVTTAEEYAMLIWERFFLGRTDTLSVGLEERGTVDKRDVP